MTKATPPKLKQSIVQHKSASLPSGYAVVRTGIVELLSAARQAAVRNVNALMTASYWEIGRRIVEAEQKGKRRAGYGEQLIERLSGDLSVQFGRGFSRPNLQQMRQFYIEWPPSQICQTVSGELAESQKLHQISGGEQGSSITAAVSEKLTLAQLAQAFALPWSAYVRLLSVKDAYARQF